MKGSEYKDIKMSMLFAETSPAHLLMDGESCCMGAVCCAAEFGSKGAKLGRVSVYPETD